MLLNMIEAGDSRKSIALKLGRTPVAVGIRKYKLKHTEVKHDRRFTGEEDELLLELRAQGMKWLDIKSHFPRRSISALKSRRENIISRTTGENRNDGKPWSTADIQKLGELRQHRVPYRQIAVDLGRTFETVRGAYLIYFGGHSRPAPRWNEEELKRLHDSVKAKLPWSEVAAIVGRTAGACRAKYDNVQGSRAIP